MREENWSSHLFPQETQGNGVSPPLSWKSVLLDFEDSLSKGHTHFLAEYMKAISGLAYPVLNVHFRYPLFFQTQQRDLHGLKSLLENQFQIPISFQQAEEQLIYKEKRSTLPDGISKKRHNKPGTRWMLCSGKFLQKKQNLRYR